MSTTRRTFLKRTPILLAAVVPTQFQRGCQVLEHYDNRGVVFQHGVASGDPLLHNVIIWTRITPDPEAPKHPFVAWEIFEDPALSRPVADGVTFTDAGVDHTVKVDVSGLAAGRSYYYRFTSLGQTSAIGRTRTLPKDDVERLRFAVASCANYPYGFFNAYRRIAERADLDAVIFLGDYLYEYKNGEYGDGEPYGRVPQPDTETVTLADYRTRHAQYKTDPDLQEAHRQHPFIAVWDDHESANNAWSGGAENHQPEEEGDWEVRKAVAIQAYFEWMPIREAKRDIDGRVYRSFRFGKLVDLTMLDTRIEGRDEQTADGCDPLIFDADRQLLGEEQEQWFFNRLQRVKSTWHLIGQQVMFGQLAALDGTGCALNPDQWDGYAAARARVSEVIRGKELSNVVVLTGDIHSSWATDLTENPFDPSAYNGATGEGSFAVEFVTPGITSPGIEDPALAQAYAGAIAATHPHIKYVELSRRGYLVLDVTVARVQAEWYHVESIAEPSSGEELAAIFTTQSGTNRVARGDKPAPAKDAPPPAPSDQA